ncbi:unnamed protein product [Prorocentrum cordatum]|uniref:Uncharacterized protein n=1 Tax=Prorocentrum cordatum TaxID=2364126 RepID=A0ABN9TCL7_9DINO|nr:unnamed protein product [Polarella glacialis]
MVKVLAASGGRVAVDFAFLQPGAWGRFAGLPVRGDAARLLQAVGVGALRLGGSTCNVDGWRWKSMRGPREVGRARFRLSTGTSSPVRAGESSNSLSCASGWGSRQW